MIRTLTDRGAYSELSRSARAFSQTLKDTPARLDALLYRSRSPGVTLTFIRAVAGSFRGGLPLGLLGLSMGGIMYSQIMLDKSLILLLNVLTLNKERKQ